MTQDSSQPQKPGKIAETKSGSSAVVFAPGEVIKGESGGITVNYKIERYVSEGWTAEVYLAVNEADPNQKVALKVLRPGSDETTISSFRSEPSIISEIRREGFTCVPEVYGLFNQNKANEFIAMEWISEETYPRLDHLLELQGPLDEEQALEISRQALILLDRLHTQVGRTYTDMQLKDFCWNASAKDRKLIVIDWNHVSFERRVIEEGLQSRNSSVMEQLKGRGAKDFDDLVHLDVLRFASYIYTFLTGKRASESGETAWGLKKRAGKHWDAISESSRQIVSKALVPYPGMASYRTAMELMKDVNVAVELKHQTDYDTLRDKMDILDTIEDRDNKISQADPQNIEAEIKEWAPERLQLINQASAVLDRINSLPISHSTDPILQKWLKRQSERIHTLYDEIPSAWVPGQNYFDLEQYLTALDLWKPIAEQKNIVHLWRQVLLAEVAAEDSRFAQLIGYLDELRGGNIDDVLKNFLIVVTGALEELKGALKDFQSGNIDKVFRNVSGALMGPLVGLWAEIVSLYKIRQALQLDALKDAIESLKGVEALVQDIPYRDILLRDPLWYSLMGAWLSEEQNKEFELSGKADVGKLIGERRKFLRGKQQTAEDQKTNLSAYTDFILGLLTNTAGISKLKNHLWAQPDDAILFDTLLSLTDDRLPSGEQLIRQALEKLPQKSAPFVDSTFESDFGQLMEAVNRTLNGLVDPIMCETPVVSHVDKIRGELTTRLETLHSWHLPLRQIISMLLKWGAPSEDVEEALRKRLFQLYADGYIEEMLGAINHADWLHAEQAAFRIAYLLGDQVGGTDAAKDLANQFVTQCKGASEDITGQGMLAAGPLVDYLRHLDQILVILKAPRKAERDRLLAKIFVDMEKLEQRQKDFEEELQKRREIFDNGLRQRELHLDEVSNYLTSRANLAALVTGFVNDVASEVGALTKDDPLDYRNVAEKVKRHIQIIRERQKTDLSSNQDLKTWMDHLQKYEQSLEVIMDQNQKSTAFHTVALECVEAIAHRNWEVANRKVSELNTLKSGLHPTDRPIGEQWCRDLGVAKDGIETFRHTLKETNGRLDDFIQLFNSQYGMGKELNLSALLQARDLCNQLLGMQARYAGQFKAISPSFAYEGLNELDRRISDWERLVPFARILAVGQEPRVILEGEKRNDIPVDAKARKGLDNNKENAANKEKPKKRVWRPVMVWGVVVMVLLGTVWGISSLLHPPASSDTSATANAYAVSSAAAGIVNLTQSAIPPILSTPTETVTPDITATWIAGNVAPAFTPTAQSISPVLPTITLSPTFTVTPTVRAVLFPGKASGPAGFILLFDKPAFSGQKLTKKSNTESVLISVRTIVITTTTKKNSITHEKEVVNVPYTWYLINDPIYGCGWVDASQVTLDIGVEQSNIPEIRPENVDSACKPIMTPTPSP